MTESRENKLEKVPLSCLFDASSLYFLPVHPYFRMSSEVNKYQDGMKIVAMSIDFEQWKKIVEGKMTNKEHHYMFARIDEAARLMTRELEIKCGKHDPNNTVNKIVPTMLTLGLRFQGIRNYYTKTKQKTPEETEEWVLKKIGEQAKLKQVSMTDLFARKAKPTSK